MKKFLKKLAITLLLYYVILWGIQLFVDYQLRNNYSSMFNEWSLITNGKLNSDLIIIGSSRALKHFDPKIFEDRLQYTSYNLGTDGGAYGFQIMKLRNYLENNKPPKIIIQNVDIFSMGRGKKEIILKQKYLPYYNSIENLKTLAKYDENLITEIFFPMYKYRGYREEFIMAVSSLTTKFENNSKEYNGYIGSSLKWDNGFEKFKRENPNIFKKDFSKGFQDLLAIVEEINNTDAILFLVWSPEYYKFQEFEGPVQDKYKKKYATLALQHDNIYFIDFTGDSLSFDTQYLYNFYHLNEKGATIFSKKVADSIKINLESRNSIK